MDTKRDFNEKGYIGKQIAEFTESVEVKYSRFFDAAHKINEITQRLKYKFDIHNEDLQEILSACLFLRILNGFQSVVILCKLGLVFDTKVILRSMLEAHFLLKAVSEDIEFAQKYILTDHVQRLKWMNIARKTIDPGFEALRGYATDERIEELKREISEQGISDISTESVARKAGMESTYNTAYRLLSAQVHCIPRSVEHYLKVDTQGKIVDFPWGPSEDDLTLVIFTSIDTLFNALNPMTTLFSIEQPVELQEFKQILYELHLNVKDERREESK